MSDPQGMPPHWPPAPSTEGLWWYLFGDPRNPNDRGMLGRIEDRIEAVRQSQNRLTRMGWAILLLLLGALAAAVFQVWVHR